MNSSFRTKALTKISQDSGIIKRRSTPGKEYATQALHGLNPLGIASNISGIIKAIKDPPQHNAGKSGKDNLMPSVGAYRMVSRIKSQAYAQDEKYHGHAKDNYLAELLGSLFTSGIVPTLAGGAIGAYLSRDKLKDANLKFLDRFSGVGKGIGVGLGLTTLGNLGALGLSAITRRRTEQEQANHDRRTRFEDWIVPGLGMYNKGKRVGRSEGDYEEHPETHGKIREELESADSNQGKGMKLFKLLALLAGVGMTGYGLYKLPGALRGQYDKMKDNVTSMGK